MKKFASIIKIVSMILSLGAFILLFFDVEIYSHYMDEYESYFLIQFPTGIIMISMLVIAYFPSFAYAINNGNKVKAQLIFFITSFIYSGLGIGTGVYAICNTYGESVGIVMISFSGVVMFIGALNLLLTFLATKVIIVDKEKDSNASKVAINDSHSSHNSFSNVDNAFTMLEKLKKLFDDGIISKEEYEEKRQKYLNYF